MAKFNLEIDGKNKSTTKGNVDWYYGGGDEAWIDIASAKAGVPLAVRNGKTVGVLETNKIVEYIWHNDNLTDAGLVLKTAATTPLTDAQIKTQYENNLDTNAYTNTEKAKVLKVPADTNTALSTKVDKITGKGLSTNDYTTSEKTKLAGLESSHFKGSFISLAALNTALPTGIIGDYADVDTGIGTNVKRYIWDATDSIWAIQAGTSTALTNVQVKTQYELNADTNAYTDVEKVKVLNVPADTNASLLLKVDKVTGKGLSANDFTTILLNKINSITAIFTTILKTAYDTASTWVSTNGATVLTHIANITTNPHSVTKANVGLGGVDNTADIDKIISNLVATALALKFDKSAPFQTEITTAISITTDTLSDAGTSQKYSNVMLDNGINAINVTVNGGVKFNVTYQKLGTGTITFIQGVGRTLIPVDSTNTLNGQVGSTAVISSKGTIDYLRISNV